MLAAQSQPVNSQCDAQRLKSLEDLLDMTATAYGSLHLTSISRREYDRVKGELCITKSGLNASSRLAAGLKMELKDAREEIGWLKDELAAERHGRQDVEAFLDETLLRSMTDRELYLSPDIDSSQTASVADVELELGVALLDARHLRLVAAHRTMETRDTLLSLRESTILLDQNTSILSNTQAELHKSQMARSQLSEDLKQRETSNEVLSKDLDQVNKDLALCTEEKQKLAVSVQEFSERLRRSLAEMEAEKEAVKAANEGTTRWKFAEAALEQDIAV